MFEDIINQIRKRREVDKKRFEEHDDNLCMLCDAYGKDKHSLFISCFYEVSEVVPEAINLFGVEKFKNRGYFLRICKNCRGELLNKLGEWRNEMIARREVPKDRDGYNKYDEFGHRTYR